MKKSREPTCSLQQKTLEQLSCGMYISEHKETFTQ